MRIIPKIMLCVTLTVPLAGCAIDVGKLAADMKRPSVTFESPESWACNEQMKGVENHSCKISDQRLTPYAPRERVPTGALQ